MSAVDFTIRMNTPDGERLFTLRQRATAVTLCKRGKQACSLPKNLVVMGYLWRLIHHLLRPNMQGDRSPYVDLAGNCFINFDRSS